MELSGGHRQQIKTENDEKGLLRPSVITRAVNQSAQPWAGRISHSRQHEGWGKTQRKADVPSTQLASQQVSGKIGSYARIHSHFLMYSRNTASGSSLSNLQQLKTSRAE